MRNYLTTPLFFTDPLVNALELFIILILNGATQTYLSFFNLFPTKRQYLVLVLTDDRT